MARNGSGTYSLPSGNPVVTGTTISSTTHNNTMSDIATALTGSLARNGEATPTANLPMAGYKLTGVGNGTSGSDSATFGQVVNAPATITLASSATVNIGDTLSSNINISGSTTITAFDSAAEGVIRTVAYTGEVPLTYNATSMQLFNGVSRTNATGDVSIFKSLGVGNWREIAYLPASAETTRTALGATTVGNAVFTAADAAAARTALGAGTVGAAVFIAETKADARAALGAVNAFVQNFRLTLTTDTPVTTSDKTAASAVYMTPYKGSQIALYDGTANWEVFSETEKSIAVPATTSTVYDVFAYNNSGVAALELAAWTNDTTRATALATQDGVLVKSGATTRRYIGSFRTTGVSGQTEDSRAKRYVWNYYNRVRRDMLVAETTASWTYQTNTYRQANGNAANQLDFIIGVSEDSVDACLSAAYSPQSSTEAYAAVGFDSVSSPTADAMYIKLSIAATGPWTYQIPFSAVPAAGRHYITWLEAGAGGTITWYGFANGNYQYGLKGSIWA